LQQLVWGADPRTAVATTCLGADPRPDREAHAALNLQITYLLGADPMTASLLAWAPSLVTVPVFTGGPTWCSKQVVPGFRVAPFDG